MNRTDRLTGIILALRSGQQTAAQLAARFEVSRRTILRDVDALCQIGVPVTALSGAGGGYTLADDYWLPPLHLTPDEATLLLLALGGLGDATDSPFGRARRTAEEKLRAVVRPAVLADAERALAVLAVVPPRAGTELAHFDLLRDAIRDGTWVRVEYQSLRRVATHHLAPRRMVAKDGRWYCAAVSLEACEERTYRLDRVLAVEQIAAPPSAASTLHAATQPRPEYAAPGHPEIVLRLTYRGLRLAEDRLPAWDRARQLAPEAWELRFRCPPAELAYYAHEIHALGPQAEALSPPALRALVRDLATATAACYACDPDLETASESER